MNGNETPLRILVVTECFWPDIYAVNDIVENLVQRGHKVTVLTGLPDYTTTKIPKEYRHGRNRHQNYKGAEVFRVQTIARHHGPIWRSLSYLSFVVSGTLRARFWDWKSAFSEVGSDFDVIYVWEVSPVTMAVPAIALKKRYKKPLFLYCMDIWPECVKAMHIKEGTLAFKLIHWWTRRIYSRCDHIAVSSRPFFEYLNKVNGVAMEKMSYLPQFADSGMLNEDYEKNKNEEHTDFLYIGNIGKAQDMKCLIDAIAIVSRQMTNDNVTFHIIGAGSEYEKTVQYAKDTGADSITVFYGAKPFDEAKEYYRLADACILTLDGSTHIGDTLPGKVQTYMAAGKPILGAMNGAGKEVITESRAGRCTDAGDSRGLAEIFTDFINNRQAYDACGENARKYFNENFTEELHFNRLEGKLREIELT